MPDSVGLGAYGNVIQSLLNTLGIVSLRRMNHEARGNVGNGLIATHVATMGEIGNPIAVPVAPINEAAVITNGKERWPGPAIGAGA